MRKIKSLLCVLLTMIISLGSMVTVKADTEIKPYENKENAVLLKREYIDLDEDTVIEIESYEEKIPSLARAGWKTTSATKTYRVKDKNTNTVFVKYILKATFRYNGKQAQCTTATPDCKLAVRSCSCALCLFSIIPKSSLQNIFYKHRIRIFIFYPVSLCS